MRATGQPIHEVPDSIDELLERGYRYAFSLAHDAIEAEDLLQDACLSILGSDGSWELSYLFATIRNRFMNWDAPDVLQNGQLGRALGSLRPEEREALFLAVVEGYTAEEIANLTARPRGTVLSLLYRTKAKLRELLRKSQVMP